MNSTPTESTADSPETTKTDFKVVDFVGEFNGVTRRWGFCYINLQQGYKTSISFGNNSQSLIVKIKKAGFYWKDLIHSMYHLPAARYEDCDPYKIALTKAFCPMEETETLVIDIGEAIEEANGKADVEVKESAELCDTWKIHCVPFLYNDCNHEKEIQLLD